MDPAPFSFFGAILTLVVVCHSAAALQCPTANTGPCECQVKPDKYGPKLRLVCTSLSDQRQLDDFMTRVNEANGPDNSIIDVGVFDIKSSSLFSLDLSSLARCNIVMMFIQESPSLIIIKPPPANGRKMKIDIIMIFMKTLGNSDLGNLLSYLDENSPFLVKIVGSKNIRGAGRGSLIIPGLSSHNVNYLHLENGEISEVLEGAFKGSKQLISITLNGNKINKVGKGAFEIDHAVQKIRLDVDLKDNKLTPNSFEPGFIPLDTGDLKYNLYLEYNYLTYLPEEVFKDLVKPNGPVNVTYLEGNPFNCDQRMQWMKCLDRRQFQGVKCINDPAGLDIFDTTLVTGNCSTKSSPKGGVSASVPWSSSLILGIVLSVHGF